MATFLNLVLLRQHHHNIFLNVKKSPSLSKLNNDSELACSTTHLLILISFSTYNVTLLQMGADLISMPKAIAREIKLESIAMGAQGIKQDEIAESLGISGRTIRRAKSKQRHFGDIEGGARKRGRKSILSAGMEDVLVLLTTLFIPRRLFKWYYMYLVHFTWS
jgi:hypothetical protein